MSRADIQQGILRVPTQFYSYMLRSFEGVFIGKDLSDLERIRLAAMIGPFYGMTGIGATSLTSSTVDALNAYLPDSFQVEEGSDAFRLIKNGPIDAIFAWADDTLLGDAAPEVSIASRVSLGDGVVDTYRNYRDANVFEIIGGAGTGDGDRKDDAGVCDGDRDDWVVVVLMKIKTMMILMLRQPWLNDVPWSCSGI